MAPRTAIFMVVCLFISGCGASLLDSAIKGDTIKVRNMLEKGANTEETKEGYKKTALMYATQNGNLEMVEVLLQHGANVNAHTGFYRQGMTPLMFAIQNSHTDIAKILINKGAKINVKARELFPVLNPKFRGKTSFAAYPHELESIESIEMTPLSIAIGRNDLEMIKSLLDKGADVNLVLTSEGWESMQSISRQPHGLVWMIRQRTLLMKAVETGNVEVLRMILKTNPEINQETLDKAREGELEKTPILLTEKVTALKIAEKNGNNEIISLLKNFASKK